MAPTPALDLARRASALAAQHDWTTLATLAADERELRQLVLPSGAAFPVELWLQTPSPDAHTRVQTEIELAAPGASEHLLGLVEVVTETTRRRELRGTTVVPAVLREHASGGLLADLLAHRTYLRAGEVATVLLGVAAGLSALNERGWAHGALTTRCVVFRHDSCPALASLAGARRLTADSADGDRRGFLRLADRLAGSLPRADGDRILEAIREPLRSGSWESVSDAVAVAVEPEAVLIPVGSGDVAGPDTRPTAALASHAVPSRAMAPHAGMLDTVLEGHPIAAIVQRVTGWLGTRRKLVAVAVTPIALAALAVAMVPPDAPTSGAVPPASPAQDAPSGAVSTPSASASSPRATATSMASGSSGGGTGDQRLRSDDPVVAAAGLLAARLACFRAASKPSCLETSLRVDSALYREDAAALGAVGADVLRDFSDARLALVQRWGDAALVSATPSAAQSGASGKSEPASVLMVRNEAGWRLRDVYRD
ncbi:hypothetical protein [Leifsonia poae]|uniref:Protein kinase domain-containing protein n=1 Tax=Leifsonia poae TaxID=110933 RepID=A0A9W6HEB2_9MICO|nr:hypothetical protein [Leifsonia poae]GLJ78312.1 hypothetical protein GCM10017584_38860 [Leifsonia poae]